LPVIASTTANVDRGLPPLILALLAPERFPHPAQHIAVVETHVSWVLLAGEFAYKIKKPVKLPFLDYSTLELRRRYCEAELRLNRRFAPDLYIAVQPITGSPEKPRLDAQGEPIEFAVKMRRFAAPGQLDRLCAGGRLEADHVSALADAVAAFHTAAATAPTASRFGLPEQVRAAALENFDELAVLLSDSADRALLERLQAWTQGQFVRLAPCFVARHAAGKIRECHGDLHLGNLVLIDGRVTLFDGIEFNEDFRWIDVASEIAFTYIDLLEHRQPGLASWFVSEWLTCSGDYEAIAVLRFYAVYRALVRAKVAAIRARQVQDDGSLRTARDYLTLAEELIAPAALRLIITHGLSGSGKTKASMRQVLADAHGTLLRVRSDVERKRLFGLAANADSDASLDDGIYSAKASQRTYLRLQQVTETLLIAGWSVVVDAAFLKKADRAVFRQIANQAGAAFFILSPRATLEQLGERIATRRAKHRDASEATPEVLKKQMAEIEAVDATEQEFILELAQVDLGVDTR
jgi:aminoglycoside phosphotransferase family enzyme/predicted kinase